MEYSLKNPARGMEKASEQITKPGILTLPEAEALLRATGADFVPAIAIGLFAGLRPEAELWHLDWKSINLADKLIDVTKSKNSISHRFVKISDNLVAWLAPYAKKGAHVPFGRDSYYTRLQSARHRAAETLESQSKESLNLRRWAQEPCGHGATAPDSRSSSRRESFAPAALRFHHAAAKPINSFALATSASHFF